MRVAEISRLYDTESSQRFNCARRADRTIQIFVDKCEIMLRFGVLQSHDFRNLSSLLKVEFLIMLSKLSVFSLCAALCFVVFSTGNVVSMQSKLWLGIYLVTCLLGSCRNLCLQALYIRLLCNEFNQALFKEALSKC